MKKKETALRKAEELETPLKIIRLCLREGKKKEEIKLILNKNGFDFEQEFINDIINNIL